MYTKLEDSMSYVSTYIVSKSGIQIGAVSLQTQSAEEILMINGKEVG